MRGNKSLATLNSLVTRYLQTSNQGEKEPRLSNRSPPMKQGKLTWGSIGATELGLFLYQDCFISSLEDFGRRLSLTRMHGANGQSLNPQSLLGVLASVLATILAQAMWWPVILAASAVKFGPWAGGHGFCSQMRAKTIWSGLKPKTSNHSCHACEAQGLSHSGAAIPASTKTPILNSEGFNLTGKRVPVEPGVADGLTSSPGGCRWRVSQLLYLPDMQNHGLGQCGGNPVHQLEPWESFGGRKKKGRKGVTGANKKAEEYKIEIHLGDAEV
ncbi:uncharacterized protein PODANS_3_2933 [Podospora anserina S mat+]|uniref:Podospora anserina S mat+ genomic DNA chromosome 3, supercontig 2 n=1 Tax=Podospora anserina (strain S / ATCC MYA-4624 / DSM 980 / FGSC 10383) TaxID=515849 RepID=B2AZ87_PODAN|nr:uncharacterized protein PODANS_3_2933 [Podospora anserina S mat+]CAP70201.1 unnamed protein product [Podospora anserina S mat+]CDP26794.1 Putative protein of unknown function [Podospora anserina S mat+]